MRTTWVQTTHRDDDFCFFFHQTRFRGGAEGKVCNFSASTVNSFLSQPWHIHVLNGECSVVESNENNFILTLFFFVSSKVKIDAFSPVTDLIWFHVVLAKEMLSLFKSKINKLWNQNYLQNPIKMFVMLEIYLFLKSQKSRSCLWIFDFFFELCDKLKISR